MRRVVLAILILALFGLCRLPVERSISRELEARHFREGPIMEESMRARLGQLGFAASLGGFRSILATFLTFKATNAWSHVKWDELESDYHLLTQLQPRVPNHWDMAHWHMGFNARRYYADRAENKTAFERKRLADAALERAKKFLLDGLRYNPGNFTLTDHMAFLYGRKHDPYLPPNPCLAAEWYAKAAQCKNAPPRALRFCAYSLADCPGKEREAYTLLSAIYRDGHRFPTLIAKIKRLETTLGIETALRIPEAGPLR